MLFPMCSHTESSIKINSQYTAYINWLSGVTAWMGLLSSVDYIYKPGPQDKEKIYESRISKGCCWIFLVHLKGFYCMRLYMGK